MPVGAPIRTITYLIGKMGLKNIEKAFPAPLSRKFINASNKLAYTILMLKLLNDKAIFSSIYVGINSLFVL
jgi:hypothetical protein